MGYWDIGRLNWPSSNTPGLTGVDWVRMKFDRARELRKPRRSTGGCASLLPCHVRFRDIQFTTWGPVKLQPSAE
ncbi:hypothetical protein ABEW05_006935 [Botrytis cinerea]